MGGENGAIKQSSRQLDNVNERDSDEHGSVTEGYREGIMSSHANSLPS